MKIMYIKNVLIVLFMVAFISGCKQNEREIISDSYPGLKWGFTTQNFIETTPVSVESAKKFIAYAREQGFSWIELRDPDASLTVDQCKEIAFFAASKNIGINYSAQRGLLENDFWDIFYKAVGNSSVFEGPGYFRALATIGMGEFGWTEEEFNQLVETANKASAIARRKGLQLTVENADTDIDGSGKPYYGFLQFIEQTGPEVTLQLDVANLFTGPVPVNAGQAENFIRKCVSRISYLHLKSARDGEPLTVLDGNPLDFKTILSIIHEGGVRYIAIELLTDTSEEKVFENMSSSIDYLIKEGIISIK
jgi:sugar phosphate isomerase/epimerase